MKKGKMGKAKMNTKKIISTLCAGILLFSMIALTHAENPPGSPYSVYGYVTINGNRAPAGIEIILSIDGRVDRKDTTGIYGNYTIDFESMPGETATFMVHIGNQYFTPITNPLFHIEHASPYPFYLNLTVEADDLPPLADAGGPYYAQINQPITFSAAGSVDLDGTISGYRWDWTNDGTWDTTWLPTSTTTHTYSTIGVFTVNLEVQDNTGAIDDDTTTATITTEAPENNPPNNPSNPHPANHASNQSIFVDLSWNSGDQDSADTVTYHIYFGTTSNPSLYATTVSYPAAQTSVSYLLPTLAKNTQFYWKITAIDNHGATTDSPLWDFMTVPPGDDQAPTKVTGLTATDAKDGKLRLNWNASTDNVAIDHYRIFRNDVFIQNISLTTYQDTGLVNGQTYTYKISAVDISGNEGALSDPASGTPTATEGSGGGGGSGEQPIANKKPVANTSKGAPYQGFVNTPLIFDGSASYDPDGSIVSWKWMFGDGTNGSGVTVSHTYVNPGSYTVILTVTDNKSATDTDETVAVISTANNPPTAPTINGPATGNKTTEYEYLLRSTDADNDTIQYMVIWADGQITDTQFFPSGQTISVMHQWPTAGRYSIIVKAFDNQTLSGDTEYVVFIDTEEVGDIGYLIDENNDGTYETYFSYSLDNTTTAQKQTNGTYLIDNNGDGTWDHLYNPTSKTVTEYNEASETGAEPNYTLLYIILLIVILLFAILFFVLAKRKKPQQPPQATKPVEEKPVAKKKGRPKKKQ